MMTIQWNEGTIDRSIDPGLPSLIHFHTHLKGVCLNVRMSKSETNKSMRCCLSLNMNDRGVVYLFDDLEAPTSSSSWSRSNINNSAFTLLNIVNSMASQSSSALCAHSLVSIRDQEGTGKASMMSHVNLCSNSSARCSAHLVSISSNYGPNKVRKAK